MTLLEETIELLNKASESRPIIATNTGLGFEWISKLANGKIPDPGVCRIERLNEYLKQKGKVK